jgi:serine protease AprX
LVNAISVKMPAGKIAELAASDDIERIYYDEIISLPPPQPVEPALTNSTQTIGANYVWETLGYTGTGIKVAVIDTGINYTHPDLGGGFGNGKKVVDGYDFVNNDENPMDDNGHGTHVAGIVAANGTIKGVAPNATLLAVKVLDSTGSGYTSDVISGIDWSVANGADIISMSLGSFTQPNDEFADVTNIVSDAAVDREIVVVVAAGNDGPGTGTISSPGSSKKVITVGASNSQSTVTIDDDTIALFSSRGPSAFGRLDPEVVAPGVSINSTNYTVPYSLMSGTSMSTPHVSGAVALLLQKHPSLTPAEVRRILMQTASNLTASNIHAFEKGAGIINVTKALTYNISATLDGDDRWEESVQPGFMAFARLDLTNSNSILSTSILHWKE